MLHDIAALRSGTADGTIMVPLRCRMPSINVKNLPKEIHRRLKERAKRNHRSLNSELIACLQEAVMPKRIDANEAAERMRVLRARFRGPPLEDEEIARLKSERRP
jgi:plasmid stability protein